MTCPIIYLILHLRDGSEVLIFILSNYFLLCVFESYSFRFYFTCISIILNSIAVLNLWKAVVFESVKNVILVDSKCVASLYIIMYIVKKFYFGH